MFEAAASMWIWVLYRRGGTRRSGKTEPSEVSHSSKNQVGQVDSPVASPSLAIIFLVFDFTRKRGEHFACGASA